MSETFAESANGDLSLVFDPQDATVHQPMDGDSEIAVAGEQTTYAMTVGID